MGHNLFVLLPSARGICGATVWNIFDWRTKLEAAGHFLHGTTPWRMPLDLARNESLCIFLSTTADVAMFLDDDVQVDESWIVPMLQAIDAGADVISAPCRMRNHQATTLEEHLFNVVPMGALETVGGLRLVECAWTGLGAVMVSRKALETLHERAVKAGKTYRSLLMPSRVATAVFTPEVVPARRFFTEAPADENVYTLDDKIFSLRVHEAGLKLYAAIDVPTVHDGMPGIFAAELEKHERRQQQAAAARGGAGALLGADGRRLR